MVETLHVAARTEDLLDVERYLRRLLRDGELSLTTLRDHDDLRPPRGLMAMPELDIPEHTLSSDDELLHGAPQPAGAGECPPLTPETVETGAVPQPLAVGGAASHDRWLKPEGHTPEAIA